MQGLEAASPSVPASKPETLGGVLYSTPKEVESELVWVSLVRAIATGDQAALHALYARTHRLVFTLALRLCRNRETAEEVTLDVFHGIWRNARQYDPVNGTVLGWIMNQARSRALDRLRFDQRKKRAVPQGSDPDAALGDGERVHDVGESLARSRAVGAAMAALTVQEREVIEAAFFSGLTHAEVAARLKQPLGTVKTRIRSGLHKMRAVLAAGELA